MQTFTGLEYLKIDVASNFGLDKLTWNDRIQWAETNDTDLEALLPDAKEPALYHAGVQALRLAQAGQPSGYPISLDATASGLQILSCLTGCETSALTCNVVSNGQRNDAYTVLYQAMVDATGGQGGIDRDLTKDAIMTALFSSTRVPKQVFGEGALLDAFYRTMETGVPGAWALNQMLLDLWQPYTLSHDWIMPDNFHVQIKVMNTETHFVQFLDRPCSVKINVNKGSQEGRSLGANITHSVDGMIVREMARRCDYDPVVIDKLIEALQCSSFGLSNNRDSDFMVQLLWKHYTQSGFLSARILDYLDAMNLGHVDFNVIFNLVGSLPPKPFQVLSVHDCFRVLPNYGNELRRQYNQILSDLCRSDMLSFIVSQILGSHVPVTKRDDIAVRVLNAEYALS